MGTLLSIVDMVYVVADGRLVSHGEMEEMGPVPRRPYYSPWTAEVGG